MFRHHKFVEQRKIHIKWSPQSIPQIIKRSRLVNLSFIIFLFLTLIFPVSQIWAIEPPFSLPPSSDLLRIKSALIITTKGRLTFELYPEDAPWHVANFKYLADTGFYRGRAFHLLIEDFIIQAGRNNNPEMRYLLPAEVSARKHEFGILGMARAPDYLNPQRSSNSTQFHILMSAASNMDSSYTIFGKLIDGADVLESLRRNDKINDVTVFMEDDAPAPNAYLSPRREKGRPEYNYNRSESLDQWSVPANNAQAASYNASLGR